MAKRQDSTLITRVVVENYRSIASCDVTLGPLTLLVGPNGSGKSNFLDVFRFVGEALRAPLELAVAERGGAVALLHHAIGQAAATSFGFRLEFRLPKHGQGHYAVRFRLDGDALVVEREQCVITDDAGRDAYEVRDGEAHGLAGPTPAVLPDRLYLYGASARPRCRPVYDALASMMVYAPEPQAIRRAWNQPTGMLVRTGENSARVLHRLRRTEAEADTVTRIDEYLVALVPSIAGVVTDDVGPFFTPAFRRANDSSPSFSVFHESDGTLRSLALLIGLFQGRDSGILHPALVGVEEPELGLHPYGAAVLADALIEASHSTQVLASTHSPELLDNDEIQGDQLLEALMTAAGQTVVRPIHDIDRASLAKRLYTAGQLLQMNAIAGRGGDPPTRNDMPIDLFSEGFV